MRKIMLRGCNGRMGQAVSAICQNRNNISIVAGVDINTVKKSDYPVYSDVLEYPGRVDAVVDFSGTHGLEGLLAYCVNKKTPLVLATTGFSEAEQSLIVEASKHIPIFQSGNMSLGVNLLIDLVSKAAAILGEDYNIEIVERHHNQKLDAPSGTALMLFNAADAALPYSPEAVYDRSQHKHKRGAHEIGIHSIRGGTIVGDHDVLFAGRDEVITLSHSACSREVFANGAVRAALFISQGKEPGLYDMKALIAES